MRNFVADRVNHRPIFDAKHTIKNTTAIVGDNVTFEAHTISHLQESLTWFRQHCRNDSACEKVKLEVTVMRISL
jgi:hypothetical protein